MKGIKGEIDQRPKRFYKSVDVVPEAGLWGVVLDGRPVKTPEKAPLALPTQKLAEVIADEWRAQDERIDIASMFNTRTANVAIDRTHLARPEMAAEVAQYASTDLVCYLAESPSQLHDAQNLGWGHWRKWAGDELGVHLNAVEGIIPIPQAQASLDAAKAHAASLDNFSLTGLVHGVGLCGSAVLGLAIERRAISAEEAFELSRMDEAHQAKMWGLDAEAERVMLRKRDEAIALERWFVALREGETEIGR